MTLSRSTRSTSIGTLTRTTLGGTKTRQAGGLGLKFVWEENQTPTMHLDAGWLLAFVCDEVLRAHHKAITSGMKADGSGPQPRLAFTGEQGRRARAGLRPPHRGHTDAAVRGGDFPDALKRTKIRQSGLRRIGTRRTRVQGPRVAIAGPLQRRRRRRTIGLGSISNPIVGTRATCRIQPGLGTHTSFLSKEKAERGIEYLYVEGAISDLIDKSVEIWFDRALVGPPKSGEDTSGRDRDGREVA